jgi:hypothetical protein
VPLDAPAHEANDIGMDDFRYIAIEEALRALHADAVLVREEVALVQSAVNVLQSDMTKVQGDLTKVQSDLTKVQSDLIKVQSDLVLQQTIAMQMQAQVTLLNEKFDFFNEHYAKRVDLEMVRTEFYKAMEAQTWKLITWITVVCSGLTTAVYFIARNVH